MEAGGKIKNGSMHELDAFDAARENDEERKREGFKTPVLILRGEQQKRRKSVEIHTLLVCVW